MRKLNYLFALLAILGLATGLELALTPAAHAQAGLSTGSIQGTIQEKFH